MLLNNYIAALIVHFLWSELSKVESLEERHHMIFKTINDGLLLICISIL
jgi:hypothetical protein